MFKKLKFNNSEGLNRREAGKLAPIVVVMLPEAPAYEALAAAFERKAGSQFLNCFVVSLQTNTFIYLPS